MKLLFAILLLSTLTISCSKDESIEKDDLIEADGYLKVGGIEYDLSAGYLENRGVNDIFYKGYNTHIELYSKGLKIGNEKKSSDFTSGKGHHIGIDMFSTTGETLENKEYIFSTSEPHAIGTFFYSSYEINYDVATGGSEVYAIINGGKVSVSKNGDEYTINIDLVNRLDEKVTGFYKGKLKYFKVPK